MKREITKFGIILLIYFIVNGSLKGSDTLDFAISINYYIDLSDSYGGGSLLSNDLTICKSWYGINLSYGYFHSQSKFLFKVPITEINAIMEIPIDEMSIMNIGTISGMIRPIQSKFIDTDILLGLSFNSAKSFFLKGVDFSYNLNENKFNYLIKDYQLVKESHIGYQIGLNIKFKFFQRSGIQIATRISDLKSFGSFFFVGGGLWFKFNK